MKTTYTIVVTVLSIVAVILSPDKIREYVMFGLLVMMISITRWESDKILKALKANTKNESEVLNIPRVSQRSERCAVKIAEVILNHLTLIVSIAVKLFLSAIVANKSINAIQKIEP